MNKLAVAFVTDLLQKLGQGVTWLSHSCYAEPLEYFQDKRLNPPGGPMEVAIKNSIEEWRRFLNDSVPGRRFRDRYRRRQHSGHDRSTLMRACYTSFGIATAIGSLLLAPLPGPGWGTFFVGLGIVASEVLYVARLLDRSELELRKSLRRAKRVWGRGRPLREGC
jgi:hypothetical protein